MVAMILGAMYGVMSKAWGQSGQEMHLGSSVAPPLTSEGFVQVSTHINKSVKMKLPPGQIVKILQQSADHMSSSGLRMDVEPCWEDDSHTVLFRI